MKTLPRPNACLDLGGTHRAWHVKIEADFHQRFHIGLIGSRRLDPKELSLPTAATLYIS
jgi:hypothetical protein